MDPTAYVIACDECSVVCLYAHEDARCAHVWDAVLHEFVAMASDRRISLRTAAWKLRHDVEFHDMWAGQMPEWAPSLAYYARRRRRGSGDSTSSS